jgi:predicted tellurium resistance membrane protein TerC
MICIANRNAPFRWIAIREPGHRKKRLFRRRGAPQNRGMEFLSAEFFAALASIIVIDLVLAGDNAIVIALAARNVPQHLQRRAILWGTVGAIIVRSAMTLVVVWLLKVPGLLLVGGALLVWIAYRLLLPKKRAKAEQRTP